MSSRTDDHTDTLKTALHGALDGLTVLGSAVPHYEKVEANAAMPYFVNGRIRMTDNPYTPGGGYKGSQSYEVQMDAFSNYDGDKEVDALRSAAVGVLMDTLSLPSGFKITTRELVSSFTIYEDDGEIRHGVVETTLSVQIL